MQTASSSPVKHYKSNDRHRIGSLGRSFLFVLFPFAAIRIILFPVVHQMYNTYEKCQQCDDRLEKQ